MNHYFVHETYKTVSGFFPGHKVERATILAIAATFSNLWDVVLESSSYACHTALTDAIIAPSKGKVREAQEYQER